MTTTVTFSDLLRTPSQVLDELDSGDVLITRRGSETLRLSKARDAEAEIDTLSVLAQLIAASLDDAGCDRIAGDLSVPMPWIELLPEPRRREFIGEFLRTARACAAVGRFERLTICLHAWRTTAEAYADPAISFAGADLDYLDRAEPVTDPRAGGS